MIKWIGIFLVSIGISLSYAEDVKVGVDGMTCPFCAGAVEKQVSKIPNVKNVDVSLAQAKIVVTFKQGSKADLAAVKKAIKEAGFTPRDLKENMEKAK